jgi:riboflavin kinase / FMN adenylyltransferase
MIKILDHMKDIQFNQALTLTFGNFDGCHIGHQKLIEKTRSFTDTKSAVMTFDPHPQMFLASIHYKKLMSPLEKMEIIERYGIDVMFTIVFDETFSNYSPEAFIKHLKRIHVKRIVVGKDARFGKNGQGRVDDLKNHFDVVIVDDEIYQDKRVSSTLIKYLLTNGTLTEVTHILKRPYRIHGKVEHGNHLGQTLGYPTANIHYDQFQIPKLGVYAVKVHVLGKLYFGMANIGHNPTINYQLYPRLEVFIFDFDHNIYNKHLTLDFISYMREEKRFSSKEALIQQLKNDELQIRQLFNR